MKASMAVILLLGLTVSAAADPAETSTETPIRPSGSLLVGLTLPDELFIRGHDSTVPIPTVRVGWNVVPSLSLEAAAGFFIVGDGVLAGAHVGARWFPIDHRLAPYLLLRTGVWNTQHDSSTTMHFLVAGGGVEYARRSGYVFWVELGAGPGTFELPSQPTESVLALYGSAGFGYRFGAAR